DVDRAAYVSLETRVEETGGILQRGALGEGKLHDTLVGFASADDAVVRPNRVAPLPLLDDVRVCLLDELAHSAEGFPAPVPEFGDSFRDELRCRLALARARLFHVLILEAPDISLTSLTDATPRCHARPRSLPRMPQPLRESSGAPARRRRSSALRARGHPRRGIREPGVQRRSPPAR